MKKLAVPFVLLILFVSQACQHKSGDVQVVPVTPQQPVDSGQEQEEIDTALCFERDILPIFISNCAKSGCHDAASRQEGYEFTSYATIIAKKFKAGDPDDTELYEKITEHDNDDRMPPAPLPRLTPAQQDLIRRWILMGAPNTTGCKNNCDTNRFTFNAGIQPLLTQHCRGCHSSSAPSGGIALDNYAGVQAVAADGRLLGAIRREPGFTPMPQGTLKLSDCKIRQVEKWIATGAPNN